MRDEAGTVRPAGRERARVTVDLGKLADNTRRLVSALPGIEIVGVTKVTCGSPEVARAMLDGGAVAIGDSRLENIARMRDAGVDAPFWLLRPPPPSLAEETVRLAEVSLETEVETVAALDAAAANVRRRHAVVAMVELGDLREGIMPSELPTFIEATAELQHVHVVGVGTSLTCYGAVCPTETNLGRLVELASAAEKRLGRRLMVSGGMSSSIELALAGRMSAEITNLRIGESIILGVSTVTREPLPGLHTDAVTLEAPVIECKVKPSLPTGELAQNAFGHAPVFEDRGERRRAICALGRQDAPPEGLHPLDPHVHVLGASSDHLILDVHDMQRPPRLGEPIGFVPNYAATLALFTSPYVEKLYAG